MIGHLLLFPFSSSGFLVLFFLDLYFFYGLLLVRHPFFLDTCIGLLIDLLIELADSLILLAFLSIQYIFRQMAICEDALYFTTFPEFL